MYRIRYVLFVVFKQKTAYEMRISDWSSDVCSSDLIPPAAIAAEAQNHPAPDASTAWTEAAEALAIRQLLLAEAERLGIEAEAVADDEGNRLTDEEDRQSVASGKRESARVDIGGRRSIKKKKREKENVITLVD